MADVPYLRPTPRGRLDRADLRRRGSGRYLVLGILVAAVAAVAVLAILVLTSSPSLSAGGNALADVSMPFGGGSIQRVDVVRGVHSRSVPVDVRGDQIWPRHAIPAGTHLAVDVTIKRPGWNSWLTGSTATLHENVVAPAARLRTQFVTVRGSAPLVVHFRSPVIAVSFGQAGHLHRRTLTTPSSTVSLPRSGDAGALYVAGVRRQWETARPTMVSWFPAGSGASAVASPAPGAQITATTPITLTFSKPVASTLGAHLPPVSPAGAGSWQKLSSHVLVFRPAGYGYGLGAKVHVALPAGVHLAGAQGAAKQSTTATWSVPGGSTVRLQQMLSILGYLPLNFNYTGSGVGLSPQAQLKAAVHAPAGHFDWRYPNTPAPLRSGWAPGSFGEMTKGALMAFENDHGMIADGDPGPLVWRTMIGALIKGQKSHFGYTYVTVDKNSQRLTVWHSGHDVISSTPVNTGIASAPTASGTYAVFEHLPVTTMSGTNPDGSHYSDPGIQWVSYFNGGDALHGFTRAQYGFPQSLGCVEMPNDVAGHVYPFTPIGTLVHVA